MGMELKAGQFITGRKKLAEELGFSEQQIRTAISKLESTGEISVFSTNKYSIITVTNWENYQGDSNEQPTENAVFCEQIVNEEKNLKNSTNKSTNKNALKTPFNKDFFKTEGNLSTNTLTNEQPTDNQQATNKQPHIKNNKNNKNYKKRENNAHAHARELPSEEKIISFCSSVHIPEEVGRKFYDYYSPRNWITTRGSDISGCWKEKLIEWNKRELPCRKSEEKVSHASYDKTLVDKLINGDD
jgi:biotin operon repressor